MTTIYDWKNVSFSRSFQGTGPDIKQTGLQPSELGAWTTLLHPNDVGRTIVFAGQVSSYRLRPGSYTSPPSELDVFFRYQFEHIGERTFYALMLKQNDGSYNSAHLDQFTFLSEHTAIDFAEDGWTTRKHLRFRNPNADPIITSYNTGKHLYEKAN